MIATKKTCTICGGVYIQGCVRDLERESNCEYHRPKEIDPDSEILKILREIRSSKKVD